MKPRDSKDVFLEILEKSNLKITELNHLTGISKMLDFYRNVRADGCELNKDGDMILFEWCTFNLDKDSLFRLVIARQFIILDSDAEQSISQLLLRFDSLPTSQTKNLKNGQLWCHSPDDLKKFKNLIEDSEVYSLFKSVPVTKVSLEYDNL